MTIVMKHQASLGVDIGWRTPRGWISFFSSTACEAPLFNFCELTLSKCENRVCVCPGGTGRTILSVFLMTLSRKMPARSALLILCASSFQMCRKTDIFADVPAGIQACLGDFTIGDSPLMLVAQTLLVEGC